MTIAHTARKQGRNVLGFLTASCQALFNAATNLRLIETVPTPGAVFLLWRPTLGRFAHTGFVLGNAQAAWNTVEGNTNPAGGREGYGVFERLRHFSPQDRFIRWSH